MLPVDRRVERRDGYLAIRSPSNPAHYWGNFLLFDETPRSGDRGRWEALFELEFGDEPEVRHRTLAWDRTDGAAGAAREEFVDHGYDLDESIGLVADADRLHQHRRANHAVTVRALDPAADADEQLWAAVVELQVENREDRHAMAGLSHVRSPRLADSSRISFLVRPTSCRGLRTPN